MEKVDAIHAMLNARSVAVVGASSDPKKFGYMTLNSILQGRFEGDVFPVNPKGGEILGLKVYKSLKEVRLKIDLVIVIVPAKFTPTVLQEAGELGVLSALILSGGFREAGRLDLEEEISAVCEKHGMHFAGPNVQGINYLPNKLCAMFYPVISTKGPLAIVSQSGTVTAALSEWAADEGLGISAAINLGNQTNLCESDYLEFFLEDKNTKVVAMYLEGAKNGREFIRAIGRVSPKKPIVILKGGRTEAGTRSAASHTGSMAGNYELFYSACQQFGAQNASDLETLYDIAKALGTMKIPKGNRVLIISTSGGAGTLGADEAEIQGLEVAPLSKDFRAELRKLNISPLATLSNPIDLVSIDAEHFKDIVLMADEQDMADIFLLNFGDPVVGAEKVAEHLFKSIKGSLAISYQGGGDEEKAGRVKIQEMGIPVFSSPERAMRGISATVRNAKFLEKRKRRPKALSLPDSEIIEVGADKTQFVLETTAVSYLNQYNIPYPEHKLAQSSKEAMKIAEGLGYPVVLKIVSAHLPHKSDVGGVAIDIKNSIELQREFDHIIERVHNAMPSASIEGVLVCKQVPSGLEVIVGGLQDSVFGPTVMFGLGGIMTEVLHDVTFRIAPLTSDDAYEMIQEISGYAILEGFRGKPKYDIDALSDLLVNTSQLLIDHPRIKELDLNPVCVFQNGLLVLDVRIMEALP
jgi:acetate---CoA ligase (ADP-forming)